MAECVAKDYRLTKIYASPLKRAAQTAAHLSSETGVEIIFDADLMEFNNGLLAGLKRDVADKLYPEVKNLPINQAVYDQETKVDFRSRAVKALNRILTENEQDSVIAIVTHGGMINQLYGAMLNLPIDGKIFFCTGDTGIHIWKISENGNYIIKVNKDDHIHEI